MEDYACFVYAVSTDILLFSSCDIFGAPTDFLAPICLHQYTDENKFNLVLYLLKSSVSTSSGRQDLMLFLMVIYRFHMVPWLLMGRMKALSAPPTRDLGLLTLLWIYNTCK